MAATTSTDTTITLPADSNQAEGIARFAIDFMNGAIGEPSEKALRQTERFFADATMAGVSAVALNTNAPRVLREEAMDYPVKQGQRGATLLGSGAHLKPEKAIVANASAVREWDTNGTNFGYNPDLGHTAGEFGHNDYYPVAVAAAQMKDLDGAAALRGMLLIDEIRGRLAEVFSLKSYKIDHVAHGAVGSAAAFGAMLGATVEQIESAIGMTVAHYIPWRAIRAGKQLSDSKGASAAISTEVAVLSVLRSMRGFRGPKDIFRNPEAIFRFFEPTATGAKRWTEVAPSPFDLTLGHSGDDFAVLGMHFKLGIYEHQSAGALQAIIDLLAENQHLADDPGGGKIKQIEIKAYEPAYGIIGNPAKMDPQTRQSADHSMAYIVATLIRKAAEIRKERGELPTGGDCREALWKAAILTPWDYSEKAIHDDRTRAIMKKITFEHGGEEYDKNYPDGIPTSVIITDTDGTDHDSGMVMYPVGHARNTTANLDDLLENKLRVFGGLAVDDVNTLLERVTGLADKGPQEMAEINDYEIKVRKDYE